MENNQPGTGSVIGSTVLETVKELAPSIMAAGIAANPQTAQVAAVAGIALQFLQSANEAHKAGLLTSAELSDFYVKVGQRLQSTHDAWIAMNAAEK
jgi:hypothetical protein